MDSKLRRITIFCTVIMLILVSGTAAGIYFLQKQGYRPASAAKGTNGANGAKAADPEEAVDYSAFLGDETFFDRDKSDYEKLLEHTGKKLNLFATSVEKDLRVQILNELGELVTGEELYITLNGEE